MGRSREVCPLGKYQKYHFHGYLDLRFQASHDYFTSTRGLEIYLLGPHKSYSFSETALISFVIFNDKDLSGIKNTPEFNNISSTFSFKEEKED